YVCDVTESWASYDVTEGAIPEAFENPEGEGVAGPLECITRPIRFGFIEASGACAQVARIQSDSLLWLRSKIRETGRIRPISCAAIPTMGGEEKTLRRMWRAFFAGVGAMAPAAGIPASPRFLTHLRSIKELAE